VQIKTQLFGKEYSISPALKGLYQAENIKTVLAAVDLLKKHSGIWLEPEKIVYALENTVELTKIMGRWQTISEKPMIICESAHNEDGIHFLMDQIAKIKYTNLHIVCGFVKDKPLNMVLSLLPKQAKYYFVKAKLPRALDEAELKNLAWQFGLTGNKYTSVRKGLASAKMIAENNDLIIVTGSIFVVAEVLKK
jgi:dihydrofolate synthase/folylpolyglutamate synthase